MRELITNAIIVLLLGLNVNANNIYNGIGLARERQINNINTSPNPQQSSINIENGQNREKDLANLMSNPKQDTFNRGGGIFILASERTHYTTSTNLFSNLQSSILIGEKTDLINEGISIEYNNGNNNPTNTIIKSKINDDKIHFPVQKNTSPVLPYPPVPQTSQSPTPPPPPPQFQSTPSQFQSPQHPPPQFISPQSPPQSPTIVPSSTNSFTPSKNSFIPSTHSEEYSSKISTGILNLGKKIISINLLNNINNHKKCEVVSPLSVAGVLYLLQLGSSKSTYREICQLLGLNENTTNSVKLHQQFGQLIFDAINNTDIPNGQKELPEYVQNPTHNISIANGLFINDGFRVRLDYENAAKKIYQSEVSRLDFNRRGYESQKYINDWVYEKTHGKIKSILSSPPDASTELVIVSALYFKALWWEEVGIEQVIKFPFHPHGIASKRPVNVDTLIIIGDFMPYYESVELDCVIVGLRYQKQLSTMYFIIPNNSSSERLINFQAEMTAEKIEHLIKNTKLRRIPRLTIPKFHIENEINLKHIFKQLNVKDLFLHQKSDLSLISPSAQEPDVTYAREPTAEESLLRLDSLRYDKNIRNPNLFVSQIIHKVDLTVDERGTEGGAATAAFGDRIMGGLYVYVNVPFLFVIRQDNTNLPLFYGSIFEPEQDY